MGTQLFKNIYKWSSDNNSAHNLDHPSAPPYETDNYALSPPPCETDDSALSPPPYVTEDYPPPPPPYKADDYAPPPPPYVRDANVSPLPSLQVNGGIQSEQGNQQYLTQLILDPGTNTQTQTHVIVISTENTGANFSDKKIRRKFVYSIIFVQLLSTLGLVALFVFDEHVKQYVQEHILFYIGSYLTLLLVSMMMVPCSNVRRRFPGNVIYLVIFSLSMAYVAVATSSFHDTNTVLIAVGICAGTSLGIMLFSMWAKFDFKGFRPYLRVLCWALLFFGISSIFTYRNIMPTLYSGLGALLMMWLLTLNTQTIIRGKRYNLGPEEYIGNFGSQYIFLQRSGECPHPVMIQEACIHDNDISSLIVSLGKNVIA